MTTQLPPFDVELLDLPDNQLGLHFYAWWVVAQAEKLGISQDQLDPELAERLRLKALCLDTDNEDLAGLERALQVIATGDLVRGGRMFREHMQRQTLTVGAFDEAKTGRRRQRANAKKPRRDALQTLIVEIVKRHPGFTRDQVLAEMRKQEHGGVIETITDGLIEWHDDGGRIGEAPVSGLKDRVSRARKFLRSR
jgi:hypothetical protein